MAKKHDPFRDPSPYGTYQGERGSPTQWHDQFQAIYDSLRGMDVQGVRLDESPFRMLEVAPDASFDVIKASFRRLVLMNHPDKGGDEAKCRRIVAAFERIKKLRGER